MANDSQQPEVKATAPFAEARGSEDEQEPLGLTDELYLIEERDGLQIWFEDIICLGSGATFEDARRSAIEGTADMLKQLAAARPPN